MNGGIGRRFADFGNVPKWVGAGIVGTGMMVGSAFTERNKEDRTWCGEEMERGARGAGRGDVCGVE
jgi:hypothetical protein